MALYQRDSRNHGCHEYHAGKFDRNRYCQECAAPSNSSGRNYLGHFVCGTANQGAGVAVVQSD